MHIKSKLKKTNMVHYIDGFALAIGPDSIIRGVPEHIGKKLLENDEAWELAQGVISDAPMFVAQAPTVAREILVPASLAFLEGLQLAQINDLGSMFFEDGGFVAESVTTGARSILEAADVQLYGQLRDMLKHVQDLKTRPVPDAPAVPEARPAAPLAPVPAETPPDAPEDPPATPDAQEAPTTEAPAAVPKKGAKGRAPVIAPSS